MILKFFTSKNYQQIDRFFLQHRSPIPALDDLNIILSKNEIIKTIK